MPNELNNNDEEINEDFADLSSNPAPLSRNRKIAVAVLAFFGIFVIVFWFAQFQANLKNPLQHNTDTTASNNSANSSVNNNGFNPDDEALKNKDTDGDGLSDWDELHVYKTIPY
ncbi:MAG: hypothetical protein NTW06_01555, partial [Candidatus Falkowbacteria bacterium]|nr:hypothetical protein [Candidatus Falkowbacteria bacterium]